ncbi:hypothetical protein ACHAXA_003488 [Cyclostephanos tholiformis]|uniref:ATP-grasp domain-containing protein n=1 Tax=Cyclostephanos tholiformis TaxID=382380 RepID=A0ABD3SF78_9STRA
MASMSVACRTLLALSAVVGLSSHSVDGWRHHPPPPSSVFSSSHHHRTRLLPRNVPSTARDRPYCYMARKSTSSQSRRLLVSIRGGENDLDDSRTEGGVITPSSSSSSSSSSSLALEGEQRSDHPSEGRGCPSSSSGAPLLSSFDIPPKIPRLVFPTGQTPPYHGDDRPHDQKLRILLLMDSFCEVHGQYLAERARDAYGVATLSLYSDYMRGYFLHLGPDDRPDDIMESLSMCMPSSFEEVDEWRNRLEYDVASTTMGGGGWRGYEMTALVCDSDSGLAHAERLAEWLNVTTRNPGGVREERRDKHLMIEAIRSSGLPALRQRLCSSREDAIEYASALLSLDRDGDGGGEYDRRVVVKPVRGCGSYNVCLCDDLDSVTRAYDIIHGSGVFGSPGQRHDAVLIQEFANGQEYAIDTVSRDGELKIVAIWKYDKRPANGAPFVYYATRLYDDDDGVMEPICPAMHAYLNGCLKALDIRWGITHSEVIVTPDGPRLVEVNCRQHNMDFLLLTMGGIGYNIYDVLLAAYFGRDGDDSAAPDGMPFNADGNRLEWDLIPDIPTTRMNACMVHLVNSEYGTLKRVNDAALYEIEAMASVHNMEVYSNFLEVGTQIYPTVDIKTDAGWIQLAHPDPKIFETDFQRIIELMPTLFEVEEATTPGSEQ